MDPQAALALILDLYAQVARLTNENDQLRQAVADAGMSQERETSQ
ncbi:outer membrane murein-binding lipoprotein Lpp [Cryobacterium sp. MP_M5]|nr:MULTISPECIES: hypothetical protein [unclassified Cryobacterium]MBG6058654.1 outer membrane murein-binding lipoprotein Lpp [Cryobacterium sp. MP_M3]MEC5177292.1 outer membrane murein-binding lipoprotein Lpp [Cryobacterium sp. MP_M5]